MLGVVIFLGLGPFEVSSIMGLRSLSVEDRDEEDCEDETVVDLLLVLPSSSNLIENLR